MNIITKAKMARQRRLFIKRKLAELQDKTLLQRMSGTQ